VSRILRVRLQQYVIIGGQSLHWRKAVVTISGIRKRHSHSAASYSERNSRRWRLIKREEKEEKGRDNITNSRSIGSTCYIARSQQVAGASSLRLFYSCFRSSIAGRKNANSNEPTNDLGHSWTRRPTRRRVQVAAYKSRPPRAAERGYEWEEGTCDDNPLRGKWFNYCYLFQQRWHDVDVVVAARRESRFANCSARRIIFRRRRRETTEGLKLIASRIGRTA
jgi:hypothetical protein